MKIISIGRDSQNDIVLNDESISRNHAQLIQHDNGTIAISDLGSTNGTRVNGRTITNETILHNGDIVQVGNSMVHWEKRFKKPLSHQAWWWIGGGIIAVALLILAFIMSRIYDERQQLLTAELQRQAEYELMVREAEILDSIIRDQERRDSIAQVELERIRRDSIVVIRRLERDRFCNRNTPGWGNSLGTVSFASDRTWTIGNQTWSDAVTATACQKETFNGDGGVSFNADCRSNPGFPGDLFSWCAVYRFASQLCPPPWRVPTSCDFWTLDNTLGGTGQWSQNNTLRDRYLRDWGGVYGGHANSGGFLSAQGSWGYYWASCELTDARSYASALNFDISGRINPAAISWHKSMGLTVRCVR